MKLSDAVKRVHNFRSNLPTIVDDILESVSKDILYLNKDQMNQYGILSTGEKISPEYSPFTIDQKLEKGQPYEHVTLKDTGAFQGNMFFETGIVSDLKGVEFKIGSHDWKEEELKEKYGEEIFGLTEENANKVKIKTIIRLREKFRKQTGF